MRVHLAPFKSAAAMTAAMAAAASPNPPEAPSGPSQPRSAAESLFNNSLSSSASAPTTRLYVDLYPAEADILSPQAGEYYVSNDPMYERFGNAMDRAMGGHLESMSAGGGPGEFGQGPKKEGEIDAIMWDLEEQICMWDRRHAAGSEGAGGEGGGVRVRVGGAGHGGQQGDRTGSRHSTQGGSKTRGGGGKSKGGGKSQGGGKTKGKGKSKSSGKSKAGGLLEGGGDPPSAPSASAPPIATREDAPWVLVPYVATAADVSALTEHVM